MNYLVDLLLMSLRDATIPELAEPRGPECAEAR